MAAEGGGAEPGVARLDEPGVGPERDEQPGPATTYPNTGAPGSLSAASLPMYSAHNDDASLDSIAGDYPSTTTTTGYAHVYEVRLYTNEAMTENLTFYPRHGYRETGRAVEHGFRRVYFSKAIPPHRNSSG